MCSCAMLLLKSGSVTTVLTGSVLIVLRQAYYSFTSTRPIVPLAYYQPFTVHAYTLNVILQIEKKTHTFICHS